jgi:hypothetical protein
MSRLVTVCSFCFDIQENPIIEAFVRFRFDIVSSTNYNLLFFELFILWGNLRVCVAWGKPTAGGLKQVKTQ